VGAGEKYQRIIMPLLSVIIPVYNEARTIGHLVERVNAVNIDKEIIVVDDGSTDGTGKLLRGMYFDRFKVIHHTRNRGKGSALITGLSHATGEYVIIQDADLEYHPEEYTKLMETMKTVNADLVMGARFTKGYHGMLIPRLGNRFLTSFLNFLFGSDLNDFFTCYKLCRRENLLSLNLSSTSFNIETEIVAKALKRRWRIMEVPIEYVPRSYTEGKKIRVMDGIAAMLSIIKYRIKG
jgi:glycosyltransferase involved in cell wall biosynthesis